jgi:hypothetical protein
MRTKRRLRAFMNTVVNYTTRLRNQRASGNSEGAVPTELRLLARVES